MQAAGPQSVRSRIRCRWCTLERQAPACQRAAAIRTRNSRRHSSTPHCRNSRVPWLDLIADYDRIRDAIEAVFPDFKDFNERIRIRGGFRLPLPPTMRVWNTASGKAEFIVFQGVVEDVEIAAPDVLKLTTIRSHDQYNTTIYGWTTATVGVFGRRDVLFVNEEDLAARMLGHGDVVDVETALPPAIVLRLTGLTAVAYDIARGSVAAYYPERTLSFADLSRPAQRDPVLQIRAGEDFAEWAAGRDH